MALLGMKGNRKEVNKRIMQLALQQVPALFVDAANCANIHKFESENFNKLFVVSAESLYRFQPTLHKLTKLAAQIQTKNIFISTFTHLFNYDNDEENKNVFEYSWEIIDAIAKTHHVVVGVEKNTIHEQLANKHNIQFMGHTVWSQRITSDILLQELLHYSKALDQSDRELYKQLLKRPLKHLGSITYTSSIHVWAFLLLSIILEQEKKIQHLEDEIRIPRRVQEEKEYRSVD